MGADARYARQVRYPAIGEHGQARLLAASVAIVGVGALGCVTANHLTRAGIGKLTLIDRDIVDRSNLQRQMLYDESDADAGMPKAIAAANRLKAINGDIEIYPHVADLSSFNAEMLLAGADLVIDGSDNFGVRYLINEYSVKLGVPWIYGGAVGASGMTLTVIPGSTPCLCCLFPEPPPGGTLDTCETAGVLSPIIDTIASVQAMEAIKLLIGQPEALHGSLMQIDLWQHQWHSLSVDGARKPNCPVCGLRRFDALDGDAPLEAMTASLCGRNTVQVTPSRQLTLDLGTLQNRLVKAGRSELNPYSLRLHLPDGISFLLFADGRALVMGTDEPMIARRVYADLMGE
ncbi:thiazole biosynthesis adenylyltransferase ThiF [Cohnella endophytica]|uniref:Thiazole biosynthesis adenylyltransferase ThiF n=1 Tax=Cohnella endophytica TaxID=2419778 RepID=A0A494XXN6_9BACL|nr:ThiF family adenylyltransferase [Cohnella endophytica]RKP54494.1 thiazole biosynthesis adenylyltransferase ThiF [Cohnella endophytica]